MVPIPKNRELSEYIFFNCVHELKSAPNTACRVVSPEPSCGNIDGTFLRYESLGKIV
jgi:hypothetical protein